MEGSHGHPPPAQEDPAGPPVPDLPEEKAIVSELVNLLPTRLLEEFRQDLSTRRRNASSFFAHSRGKRSSPDNIIIGRQRSAILMIADLAPIDHDPHRLAVTVYHHEVAIAVVSVVPSRDAMITPSDSQVSLAGA